MSDKTQITAHSGSDGTPDNSLACVRYALSTDADAFEVDVRRLSDGTLALGHDAADHTAPMWRKEQEYLSLDELIWKIYNDTGYFNYVGLMRNGELRQANLKMLFERAKQCESISFKGLYNFINYMSTSRSTSPTST